MRNEDRIQGVETLLGRIDVLDRLHRSPAHVRDLVDDTGQSRSTVNRAINELEALALVRRGDDGLELTIAGRVARARLDAFLSEFDDAVAAEAVLDRLPSETDIAVDAVAGSEPIPAVDPAPYQPLERIHRDLTDADSYRALVPTLEDVRHVRLLYEHVVTEGNPADLVVTPEVFRTLRGEFPRRMAVMAEEDGFSLFVGAVSSFGLGLFESDTGSGDSPRTTAHVVVHNESGGIHGLLVNESESAIRWAEDLYADHRTEATDRTRDLLGDSDEADRRADPDGGVALLEWSVPPPIEREGFVPVDVSYFRDEPVADPSTAWRAGLSLGEVHTGYAVSRPYDGSGGDPPADADADLRSVVADTLRGGDDCVVVGPPGSGKSTVCKAVACEWYDADRGPVLYREGDRGRSLASVDDLVATVTDAEGHALVGVEDAVRPDANRVFEAIDRLGDRSDVSFLLDAREREWRDRSDRPGDAADVDVFHVPPMSAESCERLVAHFERTIGDSVDVAADRLWAAVRAEAAAGDGGAPNEMLRLIHRLGTYADPLADGPTAFEEAVASAYEEVATDESTLSVAVLANTLNAAGIGVDRGLLDGATVGEDADTVDAAVDRLVGPVLFPRDDGGYRTVHEEWSTAFLAHVVAVEGEETAARRFGTAVSDLLALADDPERRERIGARLDDQWEFAAIVEDPRTWADETVEAVHAMGGERPKLAPLFGDGRDDTVELPASCSDDVADERPVWLGRMFLAGGYYDRAERAFERIPRDGGDRAVERLLGLTRVAFERGDYDAAAASAEQCLSLTEDTERSPVRARIRLALGRAQLGIGDTEAAREHLQSALEGFEAVDDSRQRGVALHHLGIAAYWVGDLDRASEYYERSLEISREVGDRRQTAKTLNNLGSALRDRGEFDAARECFERSLEIKRALGNRKEEATTLNNLGRSARQQGEYDAAHEYFERSLERHRELGYRRGEANSLTLLGTGARQRGDHERAREHFERALEIRRDIGDRRSEAWALTELGRVALDRGEYDAAREYFERGLEIRRDFDDEKEVVKSRRELGIVAAKSGDHDRARDHLERSLELVEEPDTSLTDAIVRYQLGDAARLRGDHDRAHEHLRLAAAAMEDVGDPFHVATVRLARGRVALGRGDVDAAREHAGRAREAFEDIGATIQAARSRRLFGRIAATADGADAAREHFREAFDAFVGRDAHHDALVTLEALVDTYSPEDDRVDEWRARARDLSSAAPAEVAERHSAWIEESP